jgi:hypothetical protein
MRNSALLALVFTFAGGPCAFAQHANGQREPTGPRGADRPHKAPILVWLIYEDSATYGEGD